MNKDQLILVLGDFYIPQRIEEIPKQIIDQLSSHTFQSVFVTGNIGNNETYEWLKNLSNNLICVKGDIDEQIFPEYKIQQIGQFKIGVIHGHQFVPWGDDDNQYAFMIENDIDILISGNTCEQKLSQIDDKYLINPGSVTGVYSYNQTNSVPGFILLGINQNQITVYQYKFDENKLNLEYCIINKI